MELITLDTDACTGDGHCMAACPKGLLQPDGNGHPVPVPDAAEQCIDCGHCVAVCPSSALRHARLPLASFLPIQPGQASATAMDALIRNRRSIRRFSPRPLPDGTLHELMDVVRHAPTARNSRLLRWHVIRSAAASRALAGVVSEWLSASGYYPDALAAFAAGGDKVLRGAPHLAYCTAPKSYAFGACDGAIAATTLDFAATARGIGTCWAGLVMWAARNHELTRAALGLADDLDVVGAMMLGMPAMKYHRVPPRDVPEVVWVD
ncbi:nitroreductase family protein [Nitratidesulfovibrio liaohensis]|uniref:Nitroreductase family protein n=1 Tax=Nitratidesulfovibrio liaohensis TaxID=2604158 RepID=A0ABY9R5U8_9BACT|nr:nitroreductase family protein [Nitratidesulfovibrio liaohensis]WMW67121.1 nitroreductase family protein [Nitratidesulfovibrio liaohensis]